MENFLICDSLATLLHSRGYEAVARHNIGVVKMESGQYDGALEDLNAAKDIRQQLVKENEDDNSLKYDLSSTLAYIARVYECTRDISAANQYYSEALDIQESQYIQDPKKYGDRLAYTYNTLAAINQDFRDFNNARKYYLKAIEILFDKYKSNPYLYAVDYAKICGNYGSLLCDLKEYDESIGYFKKSMEAYEFLERTAPLMVRRAFAMGKVNLANVYINTARLDEAASELENALSIFEELALNNNREYLAEISTIYSNYAIILIELSRIDEAEASYLRAYKSCGDTDGDLSYLVLHGRTCFNLGNFYSVYKSEQETARKYFDESIEIFSKHVKDIPQLNNYIAMALNGKAYSYVFSEEYDTALSYINKAIDCLPRDANLYDSKCEILFKANKIEEAKQTLQSLHEIIQDIDIRSLPSYNLIYGNQQQ